MTDQKPDLVAVAAEIAAAYVSRNHVAASDLPGLIVRLHAALAALIFGGPGTEREPGEEPKLTPTQVRKSITPDALISFIDGKPYKALKRHIKGHGLDENSYRAKYGLPADYPMVAQSYRERRSALALNLGLGTKWRRRTAGSV